ncbi:coniferyl-alcohol dehydrogenase [Frankia sp. Cr2]|uniref:coniferyl-alcohol dehydrogenase n=1 Tax=Frankia sp. Cr2 TaxID=3073932 RepID=UPI002AD51E54|nr:coniferyl-alcohol dehydrogenase [Frankia sp. Cr2]
MDDVLGYEGRRVLVTGAASGIGAATAELLVSLGAQVHAADLNPVTVDGVGKTYRVDLADAGSIDTLVEGLGGGLDALFNCAGVPGTAPPQTVLLVNFCGLRHLTESVVASMPAGAAVCCVGSTSAAGWLQRLELSAELLATAGFDEARRWCEANVDRLGYVYDFSKEAVNAYTAFRNVDFLADAKVRINCVNPGSTRTAATPEFTKAVKAKALGEELLKNYPRLMGRLARPVEQAWPLVFLNSERASFITGASLNVDAGLVGGLVTGRFPPVVAAAMRWTPVAGAAAAAATA